MTKKTSDALIRLQQENEKLKEDFAEKYDAACATGVGLARKLKEKNVENESLKASFADLDVLKHRVDELGSIHKDLIKERDEYYDGLKKVQTENKALFKERDGLCTIVQTKLREIDQLQSEMKCLEENYQHVISAGSLLQKQLEDRIGEIETLRAVITTCIRQGLISTENMANTLLHKEPEMFLKYISINPKEVLKGEARLYVDNHGDSLTYTPENLAHAKELIERLSIIEAIKYMREACKKDGKLAGLSLCKNFVDDIVAGKVV